MPKHSFSIAKRLADPSGSARCGRRGTLTTPHGSIETPAAIVVGTKATVKAVMPEGLRQLGAQAVLANTYHLYLQPGPELIERAGGFGSFMGWNGPTYTDSGGFQVFSLGAGFGGASKFNVAASRGERETEKALAHVDEDGVTFRSHIDGSEHRLTPERSMEIQRSLGADIIFAFDECTSPEASHEYQKEAMERTHRWAKRSLDAYRADPVGAAGTEQALYGIVQGGRFEDLRKESAEVIGSMGFDGFGIGGSFSKDDLDEALMWVNSALPEEKPRHLLGIGEPLDIFIGVEHGIDTFDCVAPTRLARTGTLYTRKGTLNMENARFRGDLSLLEEGCDCSACAAGTTRAYLAHLFRSKEMLAATLASVHNLRFITRLMEEIRISIENDSFFALREDFLRSYYGREI